MIFCRIIKDHYQTPDHSIKTTNLFTGKEIDIQDRRLIEHELYSVT